MPYFIENMIYRALHFLGIDDKQRPNTNISVDKHALKLIMGYDL